MYGDIWDCNECVCQELRVSLQFCHTPTCLCRSSAVRQISVWLSGIWMDLGGGAGAVGFFTGYFPSSEGATSTPEARACTTDIDEGDWLESVSAPTEIGEDRY